MVSNHSKGRNELKAGAVLSYLVIAVQVVAGLLFVPVALRILGQAEYGLYELSISTIGYLNLLTFGFAGAYMRFYYRFQVSNDQDGVARLNGLFMIIYGVVGGVATAVGVALALNISTVLGDEFSARELSTARTLFLILTVNIALTLPTSVFTSYIIAHERFIVQKSIQLLKALLGPLTMLLALLLGEGAIGMVSATTIINAMLSCYTLWFARKTLAMRFKFRGLQFTLFKDITVFSSFIFLNMIVDQVNWNVDKFIIGRFHGAEPIAIFGIASLFSSYYMTFSTAISSVFVPRVNGMVARKAGREKLNNLFARVGRVQFLVLALVLLGVVFFGKPFIFIWAGPGYADSYYIILLLIFPLTIPLLQNLGIEIQKAMNRHHFRTWSYLIVAILNVLVSIPVIREYGPLGAATVTGISFFIANGILMNWYYQRKMNLNIRAFWAGIIRLCFGLLPAIVLGVLMTIFLDLYQIGTLIAAIFLFTLTYLAGMWWMGMNDFERSLFQSFRNRLFGRA